MAALINADPREIIFTSCGTESNNSAIHSALVTHPTKRHVITTAVEHSANIKFGEYLQKHGYEVTFLPVEIGRLARFAPAGKVDSAGHGHCLGHVGEQRDRECLSRSRRSRPSAGVKGVLFHTDAVQTPGKLKIDVRSAGVDFLSLSAHKLHAPKGIGLLYVKRGVPSSSRYFIGGQQERGRRGGTENVPYIVGFGRAAELAMARLQDENTRVRALRDRLESRNSGEHPAKHSQRRKGTALAEYSNIAFDRWKPKGF